MKYTGHNTLSCFKFLQGFRHQSVAAKFESLKQVRRSTRTTQACRSLTKIHDQKKFQITADASLRDHEIEKMGYKSMRICEH